MAYYSEDLVDEVISRADIVEVINTYVPLKKRGANFLGLCPFHKEKTPSFTVSQDKQIYKCFGCGAGGNVISFVSKIENLDFKDTLEHLADKTNIDLASYEVKNNNFQGPSNKDLKDRVFEINLETAKYFHEALVEEIKDPKSNLTQYLKKRKIDGAVITKFGLGYGNKKDISLYTHLTNKGFDKKEILASGVVTQNIKGNIYENFAGRLIFPILDIRDRVIAFGGRVLDNSLPKYVNSPENIVYIKGKNLYGLNVAKRETLSRVIIVEGYMDTVALQKNNVTNVVASLGTALTENQAKLLMKYTNEIVLCYDSDEAGQAATRRGIDVINSVGGRCRVMRLKGAKDPDEYIKSNGIELFKKAIRDSLPSTEYLVTTLKTQYDLDNPDGKIMFIHGAAEILSGVQSAVEIDAYVKKISDETEISKDAIYAELKKIRANDKKSDFTNRQIKSLSKERASPVLTKTIHAEQRLLGLIIDNKNAYLKVKEEFSPEDFSEGPMRTLAKIIYNCYDTGENIDPPLIINKFSEQDADFVSQIFCNIETYKDENNTLKQLVNNIKIEKISIELEKATNENDIMKVKELLSRRLELEGNK